MKIPNFLLPDGSPNKQLNDAFAYWTELEISRLVTADYKPAIDAGSVAWTILVLRLLNRWNVPRPDWLNHNLAEWAASELTADRSSMKKKRGRLADPRKEAEAIADAIETYWTHKLLQHGIDNKLWNYGRKKNAVDIVAHQFCITPEAVQSRLRRAENFLATSPRRNVIGSFPEMVVFAKEEVLNGLSPIPQNKVG